MVSDDYYSHEYVPFHGDSLERRPWGFFFRQLQLRYHVCLDPLVGGTDDVAGSRFQQSMVFDVSAAVIWGMAPADENFRRKQ